MSPVGNGRGLSKLEVVLDLMRFNCGEDSARARDKLSRVCDVHGMCRILC